MRIGKTYYLGLAAVIGALGLYRTALAQDVQRSFVASPEIYKVIAENEQYRIIAVTWKAGQRDNWHSHGAIVAAYNLTDCNTRVHLPDGKTSERMSKAGEARVQPQAPSHWLENIGSSECKLIIFEPK